MVGLRYTAEELRGKLIHALMRGEEHQHYERTTRLAKFYRQIMTGDNQDDLIISYKERETEEQKKQRIEITLSRTKYVANKIYNQYDEIRRTDNIVDNIYTEEANGAVEKIQDAISEFYADEHLRDYLYERIRYLNFYDPNSYLVIENREARNEKGDLVNRSYPVEVYSNQIYDYEKYLGVLQYIVSRVPRTPKYLPGAKKKRDVYKYTMYAKDVAFVALELDENEDTSIILDPGYEVYDLPVKNKEKRFLIKEMATGSGMNPAICVGYVPDATTYGETYVSPLDAAEKLFRQLINRNSELELHRALHGFYQKFAIAEACDYMDMENGSCINGQLSATNNKCPKCEGSGHYTHKTVQDIIYIVKPKSKEEHLPLSEYVHYVDIPEHIPKSIENDIAKLEREIGEAIFSNEVFDKTEVAATATESRLNMRGLYNALSSYADNWSKIYKHCVWQTAYYLDLAEGLIVDHKFPSDFRMETVAELLEMRAKAVGSGAPYSIIQKIDMALLQKQNQDDPDFIRMVQAREEHRPFRGKTEAERSTIISILPPTDAKRLLWIYFDEIMTELINEAGDTPFFKLPYARRKEMVDQRVQVYVDLANETTSAQDERERNMFANQLT